MSTENDGETQRGLEGHSTEAHIHQIDTNNTTNPTNHTLTAASSVEDTETGDDYCKGFVPVKLSLREKIFLTLTEATHSTFAYCLSFYFDGLVALSMVLMCSETVVAWSRTPQQQTVWRTLETILTANFLVDFVLKVFTANNLIKYIVTRPTFTIDLLGILPFFIERLVDKFSEDDSSSIKALRVLRLLRFFRLSRIAYENFPDVRMFIQAVRRSKLAIAFLGMYVFGAGLFFASCIYYAETSECTLDNDGIWYYTQVADETAGKTPCSIQNMFGAWWFTLVTMTTVGYGDTNVISPWGRILTVLIMIGSLVFLALPSAIFAANLTEMYLERRLMKKLHHNQQPNNSPVPHERRPTSPLSFLKKAPQPQFQHLLSPAEDAEIENLLANVDAAGEQIQTALSSLSTHLTFIQSQQQQLQSLLNNRRRPMRE